MWSILLSLFGLLGFWQTTPTILEAPPLSYAHAHNDYVHTRPLLEALSCGFCSVEADIWAVEGKLLVGHHLDQTSPERTLEALYFIPLRDQIKRNKGHVFTHREPFTLIVEFKSSAESCYPLLKALLQRYRSLLTTYRGEKRRQGAITVLITGNLPRPQLDTEKDRLMALEGVASDLGTNASTSLIPQISVPWGTVVKWFGVGVCPETERTKLREFVARAHKEGRKVRLWGVVNTPELWKEEREAGVDWLNIDQLERFRKWAESNERTPLPIGGK